MKLLPSAEGHESVEELEAEEVAAEEVDVDEVEVEVAGLAGEVLVEFEKYRLSLLGPPQYSVALPPQVMEQSVLAVMLLVEESLLSQ